MRQIHVYLQNKSLGDFVLYGIDIIYNDPIIISLTTVVSWRKAEEKEHPILQSIMEKLTKAK